MEHNTPGRTEGSLCDQRRSRLRPGRSCGRRLCLGSGFRLRLRSRGFGSSLHRFDGGGLRSGLVSSQYWQGFKRNLVLTFFASAFLLETFLGFVAVVAFFVIVFFEETLGVAAFLTTGFEDAFALVLLGAVVFLGFSVVSLDVAFELSTAGFFTAFVAFLGLSLVEDGFLVVVTFFLVEGGFLF